MRIQEFILTSIPFLIQLFVKKAARDDLTKTVAELNDDSSLPRTKTFDFIVVGAGTGGCVVAGRLSEHFSVLLLEAGGEVPPAGEVPYFAIPVAQDPDINYFFKSVPMTKSARAAGGVVINHTGKMMGGSGSHNDLVVNRGSPFDFDNWAVITNDSSWTYENVLKYFKKAETFIGHQYGDDDIDEFYGRDGPITVDTNTAPILPLWFEAGEELGYPRADPNGYQKESFTPLNKAIKKGHRSSAYSEYIRPYEATRANLTVIRYANVSEILLDENNRAYGVAYTRHGIPQLAHATNEIILSAGAFSSPLLLMKSGIGPVETLEAAEIPVKVPLEAVGKNLGEHPAIILSPFTANDSSIFFHAEANSTEEVLRQYHEDGEGFLAMLIEGPQCFVVSSKATPEWPDIWIAISPQLVFGSPSEPGILSAYVVHGRPKSKGTIGFNTTAYKDGIRDDVQLAVIDFNMLADPEDADVIVEGIKFIFKVFEETKAFQSVNLTYADKPDPECFPDHEFRSDDYWHCVLQQKTLSWLHMVGSCSMGPEEGDSTTSVVDPKFRVRGVQSLRVVDASVIPEVPNANLNQPVIMVAEKAADEILKAWAVVQ